MLTRVPSAVITAARNGRFAIIASRYNSRYVDAMLQAARSCLRTAGIRTVEVVRVPGAFEIPVVAAKLASGSSGQRFSALICLGVILRGETTHAQFIGETVTMALAQIQIAHYVPIIHEVLLLENAAQAEVRCLGRKHNRGREAAQTALEMAALIEGLGKTNRAERS